MQIKTDALSVKDILKSKEFEIPYYQRNYSWDEKQVKDLYKDSINAKIDNRDHFLGSIVVFTNPSGDKRVVVDGQQRLTTIAILLCRIRDFFHELGHENSARAIQHNICKKDDNDDPLYVIEYENRDLYLQNTILMYRDAEYHQDVDYKKTYDDKRWAKRIEKASEILDKCLREDLSGRTGDDLKRELEQIRDAVYQLKIIYIELDSLKDAHIVFQTLNTRGLDLSHSDLIKAHLLQIFINQNDRKDVINSWQKMEQAMPEQDRFEDFLYHSWISRQNFIQKKYLFLKVEEFLAGDLGNARQYIKSLQQDWEIYMHLENPTEITVNEFGEDAHDCIQSLSLVHTLKQHKPYLLALMRLRKHASLLKQQRLATIFQGIERFHFVYSYLGKRPTNRLTKLYATAAKKICEIELSFNASGDKNIAAAEFNILVKETEAKLKNLSPSKDELYKAFNEKINYRVNTKIVRYVLKKLAKAENLNFPVGAALTIEHILSQSEARNKGIEQLANSIGNLILLPQTLNENLKNNDAETKLKRYKECSHSIPEFILKETSWGEDQIKKRNLDIYEKLWNLNAGTTVRSD